MDVANDSAGTVIIDSPHDHDLICGRGGRVNSHPGNRRFRNWVNERKEAYTLAQAKGRKFAIAQEALGLLRAQDPPGRVLKYDNSTGIYTEVSEKKALSKTTQALREGAPELRKSKGIVQDHHVKTKMKSGKTSSNISGRPTTVHIKLSSKTIGGQHYEKWHDNDDDDADESSSVEEADDASSLTHNAHDNKSDSSEGSELQAQVSHNVSYDSGDSHSKPSKQPKTTTVASVSDDKSIEEAGTTTPPTDGGTDLLYALATTCAKQASSATKQDVSAPTHQDRLLVTPDQRKSLKLPEHWVAQLAHTAGADQGAILERLRKGSGLPPASFSTLSSILTPSENARLKKEKTVQTWLITNMPYLHTDDVRSYTRRLVDDGFDSLPMLTEQLEEDDLDFMKKGHKRALLKVIQAAK